MEMKFVVLCFFFHFEDKREGVYGSPDASIKHPGFHVPLWKRGGTSASSSNQHHSQCSCYH